MDNLLTNISGCLSKMCLFCLNVPANAVKTQKAGSLPRLRRCQTLLCSDFGSDAVALCLDDFHDLGDVLLAGIVIRCFHHHANDRLGTGFADENAAGIAQRLRHDLNCRLHRGIVLRRLLVGDPDVFQHLRVDGQRFCQFAQGLLLGQHDFHHLETGQDAVTGAGILAEDDVTALLTADTAAVLGQ